MVRQRGDRAGHGAKARDAAEKMQEYRAGDGPEEGPQKVGGAHHRSGYSPVRHSQSGEEKSQDSPSGAAQPQVRSDPPERDRASGGPPRAGSDDLGASGKPQG